MSLVKVDDSGDIILITPSTELPIVSMKIGNQAALRMTYDEVEDLLVCLASALPARTAERKAT